MEYIGVKNKDEKRELSTSILKRSWVDLGPLLDVLSCLGPRNRAVAHTALVFMKIHVFDK